MKMTLGERVYYTGDMANQEDAGTIVRVRPPSKWAPETYDIDFDDGRESRGVFGLSFDPGSGRRFWPLDEWLEDQKRRIAKSVESMKAMTARCREKRD